jgi:hypothetical protein
MVNALSNPYEITAGGITCKCSPYKNGSYIAKNDLERMKPAILRAFKKALFAEYVAREEHGNDGIIVANKKDYKSPIAFQQSFEQ